MLVQAKRFDEVVAYLTPHEGTMRWADAMLAAVHRENGRPAEAERLLRALDRRHPDDYALILEHARLLVLLGDWAEARARYARAFEVAARQDPTGPQAIKARMFEVKSWVGQGRPAEAIPLLEWLDAHAPADEEVQTDLTGLWLQAGRLEEGLNRALAQWRSFTTHRQPVASLVTHALYALGRVEEAREFLTLALCKFPRDRELSATDAKLFGGEAGRAAARTTAAAPGTTDVERRRDELLRRAFHGGEGAGVLPEIEQLAAEAPGDPTVTLLRGTIRAFSQPENAQLALDDLEPLVARDPGVLKDETVLLAWVTALRNLERFEQLCQTFDRAPLPDPNGSSIQASAALALALAARRTHRNELALRLLAPLAHGPGRNAVVLYNYAGALSVADRDEEAVAAWQETIQLAGGSEATRGLAVVARFRLAESYAVRHQFERAEEQLRWLRAHAKTSEELPCLEALLQIERGDPAGGLRNARGLYARLTTERYRAARLVVLALRRLGRPEDAREALNEFLTHHPDDGMLLSHQRKLEAVLGPAAAQPSD